MNGKDGSGNGKDEADMERKREGKRKQRSVWRITDPLKTVHLVT